MAQNSTTKNLHSVNIQDESERTKAMVARSGRAYEVPLEIAQELEGLRAAVTNVISWLECPSASLYPNLFTWEVLEQVKKLAKLED